MGAADRRGVGLFRRAHRQRHPARGRHHAVVPDHRAGDGGGGRARQAHRARRRLEPDRGDRAADHPEDGAGGAVLDAVDRGHAVHRCGARGGLQPQAHHPAPHPAQHRRALPDHGDGVHGAGHPAGGEPVVPGARA